MSERTLPLTQHELDEMTCADPDCHHCHPLLQLTGSCHPKAPQSVWYDQSSGVLTVVCSVCNELVVEIEVAE